MTKSKKVKAKQVGNRKDPRLIAKIQELLQAGETKNKKILQHCKENMPGLVTMSDSLFSALVTYYKRKLGLIQRGHNTGPVRASVTRIEEITQEIVGNLTELQDIYTEAEDFKSARIILNLKRRVQMELMVEK